MVTGDWNVDPSRPSREQDTLYAILCSFGLKLNVEGITRANEISHSQIDYIVTNFPEGSHNGLVVATGLSDHYG